MAYPVVVDSEFLLERCECFDQPQVLYKGFQVAYQIFVNLTACA